MPDFNEINKDKKKPFPMESDSHKFPGIKEAFQKGGKEMWIYIGVIIVIVGIIIAIIAGAASHSNKVKQQQLQAAQSSSVQISKEDQAILARKATRKDITQQEFTGAIQAAGLTLDTKTAAKTMKQQGGLLTDYAMALGNKQGKAYDAAMEYREFKNHADALAFTMNYCTSAVTNVPGIKPNIYYFDNQGGELSATATGYYFRAYCYGNKVVAMGCSAAQASNMNKIFNTIVRQ